jgi:lipopolysaccharide/colanic/teichoic acid biosynthesis glycosyltransferase
MKQFYKKYGKRLFDIILAVPLIILLSPFMIVIALLIKFSSSGKVIFVQDRIGKDGCIFPMYKFRTMFDKPRVSTKEVFLDDMELFKTGKLLRRFKLDELPQLLNIIKGDISFVGPRPLLPSHFKKYNELFKERFDVSPGLTGLAQTSGNIYLKREKRFEYDLLYINQISFFLDVITIIKTIYLVFVGEKKFLNKNNK